MKACIRGRVCVLHAAFLRRQQGVIEQIDLRHTHFIGSCCAVAAGTLAVSLLRVHYAHSAPCGQAEQKVEVNKQAAGGRPSSRQGTR